MTKILVVSEALGEPNHKRGIFHFTRELIRSLAGDGHELTLLVETTRRYRKLRRRQQRTRLLPDGSRLIELLALYRFLDEADMNAPVMRSSGGPRRTIDWFRGKLRAATSLEFAVSFLRALHVLPASVSLIENHADGLEYVPTDLRHLRAVRRLPAEPGFYSYQDTSALLRLPPPRIDARGYDVILVDTPTRVAIQRKHGAKVICVVHDLLAADRSQAQRRRDAAVPVARCSPACIRPTSSPSSRTTVWVASAPCFRNRAHLPARVEVYPRTRLRGVGTAAGGRQPAAGAPISS